jgi:hypothetical protein
MVLNGPNVAFQDAADGLEWAQYCSLVTLPIALNGPGVSRERCCRRSQMGPALLLKDAADGLEWAQYCSSGCFRRS